MRVPRSSIQNIIVGGGNAIPASYLIDSQQNLVWERAESQSYTFTSGDGAWPPSEHVVDVTMPDWALAFVVGICGGGGGGEIGDGGNNTDGRSARGGYTNMLRGWRTDNTNTVFRIRLGSGGEGGYSGYGDGDPGNSSYLEIIVDGVNQGTYEAGGGAGGYNTGLSRGAGSTGAPSDNFVSLYTRTRIAEFRPNTGGAYHNSRGRTRGSGVGGGGGEGGIFGSYTDGKDGSAGSATVFFFGFRDHTVQ